MQNIPLNDLNVLHQEIADELYRATSEVAGSGRFTGGPVCERFAEEFAAYCGVSHCVPCGSGSDAMYLALRAVLGLGDGQREVISVSHAFAATAEAIANAGYQPVLVDVDPKTYLMDLDQVEAAITPSTAAIVPVHLYGQMVSMPAVAEIARRHRLAVIEDAAQCHGATYDGCRPGQLSHAAVFSFHPDVHLGAWGDAGAVVTRGESVADKVKMLADHGRPSRDKHHDIGIGSRMDALQAAVLSVKLRHLDRWNEARRQAAGWYREFLGDDADCVPPAVDPKAEHVYHRFVIQTDDRDELLHRLTEAGIGAEVHYPVPVHEQPAYDFLGLVPEALPVTHGLCRRVLSLPIFPGITRDQVENVSDMVRSAVAV